MSDLATPRARKLQISTSAPAPGVVLLTVAGEVDALTDNQFATALRDVWKQSPPDTLLLDLTDVPFLGSSGLGHLVGAVHQAHDNNARFGVCAPSRPAQRAIEVTALDQILPIYPSTAAALGEIS